MHNFKFKSQLVLDGMCCVMREEEITTLAKDPILECTHKSVEKCHYTYVTEFTPAQAQYPFLTCFVRKW